MRSLLARRALLRARCCMMSRRPAPLPTTRLVAALALMLFPMRAWGWGSDGHRIVAKIAADNLSPAAQSHVASILGVPSERRIVATAMEEASIRPDDSKFRDENPST